MICLLVIGEEGMDNDDRQVGRVMSRREVLALFGAAGAALLAACATGPSATPQPAATTTQGEATAVPANTATTAPINTPTLAPTTQATTTPLAAATAEALPACVVVPAMTEGPYFVDEKLNRSDIRPDPSDGSVREGAPLQLTIRVSQVGANGCAPLAGAMVDIWHCDAQGVYSDVQGAAGTKFLRGYQVTDANGAATFTTIYPGWYQGRAVHIHFKVRAKNAAGQEQEFTSQFFFDDAVSDQVYAQAPYNTRGQRTTRNSADSIYGGGGNQLTLALTTASQGYATTFDMGMQMA
jgi:protocatechuate 3,4-dioxygenase beta subunit